MVNNNSGFLLNKRYRLVEQIGEGGMANVYLAIDTILDRKVAIKVLRGDLSNDEKFVQRFQREALASTTLEHPNLVQVYDVGEEQNYHYIVMEYIEGKTLKQLLKQYGPLTINEVVDVMEQLVSAVEHAHSRGIIHRDIKPQNIMVRSDGTVKLTDFGIAVAQNAAQLTQTNSIMGSVHYLAPEIARGELASAQSDIYSLGILMFELLTGTVPFAGESAVNIALMHMENDLPSAKEMIGDELAQPVENVIIRATAKNKNNRYKTAHEMLIDLSSCNSEYRANEPKLYFTNYDVSDDNAKTKLIDKKEIEKISKPNNKKKKMIIGGSIVAAVLLIGIIMFFALRGNKAEPVIMPNLVNSTKEQALEKLYENKISESEGYTITYKEAFDDKVKDGKIIKTNPKAKSELKKDANITITISKGKKLVVPDLMGLTEAEAKAKLDELKLTISVTYKESPSDTPYTVILVSPSVGSEVKEGDTVKVTISLKEKITMLNVVRLTYGSAYTRLQELGLLVSSENCTESATVIAQSIASGAEVEKNQEVKLTCEVVKPVEPVTPVVPETPTTNE